jgi:hypothetical protein
MMYWRRQLNIANYADECVCILVDARSKARICGLLLDGIAGSNTAWDMDVCLLCVLCVVR